MKFAPIIQGEDALHSLPPSIQSWLTKNKLCFPPVYISHDLIDCDDWVEENADQHTIGVDMEFVNGRPSLLQLGSQKSVFLLRLQYKSRKIFLPNRSLLVSMLENPRTKKLAVDASVEIKGLQSFDVRPSGFHDLKEAPTMGMSDLCWEYLGLKFRKKKRSIASIRTSNWDSGELKKEQIGYAAFDAWVCLLLLNEKKKKDMNKNYKPSYFPDTDVSSESEDGQIRGRKNRRRKKEVENSIDLGELEIQSDGED